MADMVAKTGANWDSQTVPIQAGQELTKRRGDYARRTRAELEGSRDHPAQAGC